MSALHLPWAVVYKRLPDGGEATCCDVVDRYNEQVAFFEDVRHAERVVRAINQGTDASWADAAAAVNGMRS